MEDKNKIAKLNEKVVSANRQEASSPSPTQVADRAGKYLTFRLGSEEYGVEILKVESIIGMMPITEVPGVPSFVRGVINLRGKVIPVIDLRLKFGKQAAEDTQKTCIVVVQIKGTHQQINMGIVVEEVYEVLEISAEQIEPAPEFGTMVNTDFLVGMGKIHEKVMMMLDIDRVLTSEDLTALENANNV